MTGQARSREGTEARVTANATKRVVQQAPAPEAREAAMEAPASGVRAPRCIRDETASETRELASRDEMREPRLPEMRELVSEAPATGASPAPFPARAMLVSPPTSPPDVVAVNADAASAPAPEASPYPLALHCAKGCCRSLKAYVVVIATSLPVLFGAVTHGDIRSYPPDLLWSRNCKVNLAAACVLSLPLLVVAYAATIPHAAALPALFVCRSFVLNAVPVAANTPSLVLIAGSTTWGALLFSALIPHGVRSCTCVHGHEQHGHTHTGSATYVMMGAGCCGVHSCLQGRWACVTPSA